MQQDEGNTLICTEQSFRLFQSLAVALLWAKFKELHTVQHYIDTYISRIAKKLLVHKVVYQNFPWLQNSLNSLIFL